MPSRQRDKPPFATLIIGEDISCLTCGYNLRGLSGDPVRCPECGELSRIEDARVPAAMVQHVLYRMETAPTACTAMTLAIFADIPFVVFSTWGVEKLACVSLLLLFTVVWIFSYHEMKRTYCNQPGWRAVLVRFHFAVGLFLIFPGCGVAGLLTDNIPVSWLSPSFYVFFCFAWSVFTLFTVIVYRRTQKHIEDMQQSVAIQIARDTLRLAQHRLPLP